MLEYLENTDEERLDEVDAFFEKLEMKFSNGSYIFYKFDTFISEYAEGKTEKNEFLLNCSRLLFFYPDLWKECETIFKKDNRESGKSDLKPIYNSSLACDTLIPSDSSSRIQEARVESIVNVFENISKKFGRRNHYFKKFNNFYDQYIIRKSDFNTFVGRCQYLFKDFPEVQEDLNALFTAENPDLQSSSAPIITITSDQLSAPNSSVLLDKDSVRSSIFSDSNEHRSLKQLANQKVEISSKKDEISSLKQMTSGQNVSFKKQMTKEQYEVSSKKQMTKEQHVSSKKHMTKEQTEASSKKQMTKEHAVSSKKQMTKEHAISSKKQMPKEQHEVSSKKPMTKEQYEVSSKKQMTKEQHEVPSKKQMPKEQHAVLSEKPITKELVKVPFKNKMQTNETNDDHVESVDTFNIHPISERTSTHETDHISKISSLFDLFFKLVTKIESLFQNHPKVKMEFKKVFRQIQDEWLQKKHELKEKPVVNLSSTNEACDEVHKLIKSHNDTLLKFCMDNIRRK